jgi:hypothetical protein
LGINPTPTCIYKTKLFQNPFTRIDSNKEEIGNKERESERETGNSTLIK